MDRRTLMLTGGAAAVLGGAAMLNRATPDSAPLLVGMANAQEASGTVEIQDMVMGSADAPIEIIEYASFTCPHCASFHSNVFPQLKTDYIETGKVRFIYREVYFDRFGLWASMVARCGGEARFFGIADLIYEKQRDWTASGDPATIAAELQKIGKIAGIDDETMTACMSDGDFAQSLVNWYETNRENDDINSTPTFIIDGEKMSNMPLADFQTLLDDKIAG